MLLNACETHALRRTSWKPGHARDTACDFTKSERDRCIIRDMAQSGAYETSLRPNPAPNRTTFHGRSLDAKPRTYTHPNTTRQLSSNKTFHYANFIQPNCIKAARP